MSAQVSDELQHSLSSNTTFDDSKCDVKEDNKDSKIDIEYTEIFAVEMETRDDNIVTRDNNFWASFDIKNSQMHLFSTKNGIEKKENAILILDINKTLITQRDDDDDDDSDSKGTNTTTCRFVILDKTSNNQYIIKPRKNENSNNSNAFLKFIEKVSCKPSKCAETVKEFNTFLNEYSKIAENQSGSLPKLSKKIKKIKKIDKTLSTLTLTLGKEEIDIVNTVYSMKNQFWNLMIDARALLHGLYVDSLTICSVLKSWQRIFGKNSNLTNTDKKKLLYGLKELEKMFSEEKHKKIDQLKEKCKELENDIVKLKAKLDGIYQRIIDTLKSEKASWCSIISCAVALLGGIAGLVLVLTGTHVVTLPFVAGRCVAHAMSHGIGIFTASSCIVGGAIYTGHRIIKDNKKNKIINNHSEFEQFCQFNKNMASDNMVSLVEQMNKFHCMVNTLNLGFDNDNSYKNGIPNLKMLDDELKQSLSNTKQTFDTFSEILKNTLNGIQKCQKQNQMYK